jgi:hypothetical protein
VLLEPHLLEERAPARIVVQRPQVRTALDVREPAILLRAPRPGFGTVRYFDTGSGIV